MYVRIDSLVNTGESLFKNNHGRGHNGSQTQGGSPNRSFTPVWSVIEEPTTFKIWMQRLSDDTDRVVGCSCQHSYHGSTNCLS